MAEVARRRIASLAKSLNVKGVKSIKFSYDPFGKKVRSIREVAFLVHSPTIIDTNISVQLKVNVLNDRSTPKMHVEFLDSTKALFKTTNLTTLEILEQFNSMCIDKHPQMDSER